MFPWRGSQFNQHRAFCSRPKRLIKPRRCVLAFDKSRAAQSSRRGLLSSDLQTKIQCVPKLKRQNDDIHRVIISINVRGLRGLRVALLNLRDSNLQSRQTRGPSLTRHSSDTQREIRTTLRHCSVFVSEKFVSIVVFASFQDCF